MCNVLKFKTGCLLLTSETELTPVCSITVVHYAGIVVHAPPIMGVITLL